MAAPRIVRIAILPFGMVNCHLIIGDDGCVLVDAGLPGAEGKVARALKRHGLTFADIRLIVITHAHVDHAGGAARLRQLTGAPVLAHCGDLAYYRQLIPMNFCSTGWFGRLFLRTGLILQPYEPFTPDILMAEGQVLDLSRFGVEGVVRHTPGHTAGSVSIELASREVLVGDLIASGILLGGLVRTQHAIRPPFEEDPQATAVALQRLVDAGMETFYMGHGGPLPAAEVRAHACKLRRLG
ncbi:MAG: MBL fold metallo-hydrolase [Pseudomonadota bacterium]